jgi:hypothetical protein
LLLSCATVTYVAGISILSYGVIPEPSLEPGDHI